MSLQINDIHNSPFGTKAYTNFIKENSQLVFLYRASKDGFKGEDFHKFCDKKGETVMMIKTTEGHIFGGYTDIDWTG